MSSYKKLKSIKYLENYKYFLEFEDGKKGVFDFQNISNSDAFSKWSDLNFFKEATIDKLTGTITWPNGLDIAPEMLYEKIS